MKQLPVVLVHGAANSSGVWSVWRERLEARGHRTLAPDLRGHGRAPGNDLPRAVMADYVEDVSRSARDLPEPPVVIGWSMGGLVALMYGALYPTRGVIALGPSMPAQLLESPSLEPLTPGVFGPEAYGIFDRSCLVQPTMPDLDPDETRIALASLGPESSMARQDRKRGIFIDPDAISGSVLVVAGERDDIMTPGTCRRLSEFLSGRFLEFEGASHWGLVLNRRALDRHLPDVFQWVEALG
ncbi:MAG TPA: alpha/beta fold hydrolase [Methylomirabilota bacterium]|nr:alpha/beta fold hydrolase [Methylomirabilota bacterium]